LEDFADGGQTPVRAKNWTAWTGGMTNYNLTAHAGFFGQDNGAAGSCFNDLVVGFDEPGRQWIEVNSSRPCSDPITPL
jgi:hypothetical protein